jgi:hypothetical protein
MAGALIAAIASVLVAQAPIPGPSAIASAALALANTLTTVGNFPITLTATGTTTVTLPTSGTLATLGANTFTGDQTLPAGNSINWVGRSWVGSNGFGLVKLSNINSTVYAVIDVNSASIGTGFGTSPSVTGVGKMGAVNVGTGGTATTGTITFTSDAIAHHFCIVSDNTHPAQNTTTSCSIADNGTATTLTISTTAAWAASDVITWEFLGTV